ncbi:C40 family peptidase, partial [Escherichia coli]
HPGGLPWLSEADRRLQIKSALSWWLVCRGDIHKFRCVPHLTGRRFEHGVTDCYTLFRDAYHLAGIDMPDFEREDDWWRNGQNLYLDNMEATGFYRISLPSAQPGDILLCCFGASVANHAAIYCGNDERIQPGVTATGTYLPSRGFTTIWPPPQPVCEHGSGSHPCPVDADAGIPPSDERRLVPDTYCR